MPRSKSFDANQHLTKALAAIDGQIQALQAKRAQLATIISGSKAPAKAAPQAAAKTVSKKKRVMTEEAKQKISAAQKKRWENEKKKK
ncbi:MAG: hypothetical protein U0Y68_04810 [Blastocatellia bacterium]